MITVLSATAVLHGSITLGVMLSIQYIIGQMQGPISQFVSFMQDTQDAQLSLERLGEIHGKPDEETEGMDQDTQISGKDPIQLQNVVFTYGSEKSKRIIKGLSLDIPAGKRYRKGQTSEPQGAGKSPDRRTWHGSDIWHRQ